MGTRQLLRLRRGNPEEHVGRTAQLARYATWGWLIACRCSVGTVACLRARSNGKQLSIDPAGLWQDLWTRGQYGGSLDPNDFGGKTWWMATLAVFWLHGASRGFRWFTSCVEEWVLRHCCRARVGR